MLEYKIEKPDLSKISNERKIFLNENKYKIYFKYNLENYSNEKYLFRDKIKFQILPEELENYEELWYIITNTRLLYNTDVKDKFGENFGLAKPKFLEELLHKLDLSLGGTFLGINLNDSERKIFLQNGITEEAISTSQLEGAMTSSKDARDMIKKGRRPFTRDEKMILNSYKAMNFINSDDFLKQKLSLELLLELQKILTKDTLDDKDQEGKFRTDADEIVVQNSEGTKVFHIPPNEDVLYKELNNLLAYANDEDGVFTHPFIKATILHFWIGYLHPFCDGNGRTARSLFYWYLLKKGYWGFSYIPISTTIKNSKIQYRDAYIYSEQDSNDLTYFLVYMANKTKQAFVEFEKYVNLKKHKQKDIFKELNHLGFNERQIKLIAYFLENLESYTNNSIHKNYYGIAINTAKRDLEELFEKGFLKKQKQGKYVNYFPVNNLKDLTS
ncbi:MAG: Fic family protein [Candidatus Gracilibacteria bacterium]|nr:Fic family protein [Candidatus Gracilibacteria bacterium]